MTAYLSLFASAFLAATLLPLSSEAVLAVLSSGDGAKVYLLIAIATVGNTLGALFNWVLGRYCLHWQDRRWFPVKPAELQRATSLFNRYGRWSLLLAWLPLVGDPLTFLAGVFQVPLLPFTILVAVGKGARYAAVVATTLGLMG